MGDEKLVIHIISTTGHISTGTIIMSTRKGRRAKMLGL